MLCALCKNSDTRVLDSRDEGVFVRRRRECKKCLHRFTTFEYYESQKLKVAKRSGEVEIYDQNKLVHGIHLALEKRPFDSARVNQFINDVEQDIMMLGKKIVTSKEIGKIVLDRLRLLDDVAYLRFLSVYKKFGSAKKFQKEAEKLSG